MFIRSKYPVAAAVIAALVLFGCKKQEEEPLPPPPPVAKKKAADIFDEFYMDDAKKAAPAAAQQAAAPPATAAKSGYTASASSGMYRFNPNGRYVVQVNSTALQGGAQKMVNKLKNMGFPAYIAEVENPTPELTGLYFRVRIGGFDALSEAKAFAENALRPEGYDYWVDRRANDNVGIQGAGFGGGSQQANRYQQYQAPAAQPAPQPAPAPAAQPAPAPAPVAPPPPQAAPAPQPAAPPAAPTGNWNTESDQWGQDEW